jgi:hypothetical protein
MEQPVGGMLLGFSSCQAADYSSAEEEEEEDKDIEEWKVEDELTDESSGEESDSEEETKTKSKCSNREVSEKAQGLLAGIIHRDIVYFFCEQSGSPLEPSTSHPLQRQRWGDRDEARGGRGAGRLPPAGGLQGHRQEGGGGEVVALATHIPLRGLDRD